MFLGQPLIFLIVLAVVSSSVDGARQNLTGSDWIITDDLGNYTAPATVPGTIHTSLLAAKLIPDPYSAYNDVDLRPLVYRDWTYTKNFSLTSDFLAANETMIHLRQVDTVANVSINGCPIGRVDNMFIAYTFSIPNSCLKTANQIKIYFRSPVIYAANQSAAYNDTVPPLCPPDAQHGECHIQFIRKEPCSFSWDWGPAFAPIGIPGDIYIEAFNRTDIVIQLESVNVAMYIAGNKTWRVDVILSSINDLFISQLKFVLTNTSWSYETNMTFNQNLSLSLNIPDEQVLRWWPNGFGAQPLYELSVSNQGQNVGSRLIGFRTVELIQRSYGQGINGTSFYFSINSQPIFVKGSNWIPSDAFQERVTDEKLERLLRSAQLANMNMLRIWGGGIYERHSFYEIADRLGIMLWHDFMFACSLYPVDDAFLNNVRNEVLYQVKRLQYHASIVLWAGNNENEAAVAQNWYGVPAEKLAKVKDDYRKLYVDTVMKTVQQVDLGNNRPFVTSSPSNGNETITENYIANDPQNPLYGDVHFYGYQDDSWNTSTYPITRFLSETGIQSLPSVDTWFEVTNNASDLDFLSPFILHREHSGNQMQVMMNHIQANLPLPVSNNSVTKFTQMVYLSQIHQAMTLRSIGDFCRYHSPVERIDNKTSQGNTMGLMYWQINDIWQAPTWATIEYNLKWKMSHYYVRHMYEPIYPLLTLTPYLADVTDETAKISIDLVNDFNKGTQGQLLCSIYGTDRFSVRLSFAFDVSMAGAGLQHVADFPYPVLMRRAGCNNTSPCLFHCTYNGNNSTQVSQTLFLNRPKNYQLSQPNFNIQGIKQLSPLDYQITVVATAPALFVWLDVIGNNTGYFSRNGFNMLEPTTNVVFHSWEPQTNDKGPNFDIRHTTLYDVTLP